MDTYQMLIPGCGKGGYLDGKNVFGGHGKSQSILQQSHQVINNRKVSVQLIVPEFYRKNNTTELEYSVVEHER